MALFFKVKCGQLISCFTDDTFEASSVTESKKCPCSLMYVQDRYDRYDVRFGVSNVIKNGAFFPFVTSKHAYIAN